MGQARQPLTLSAVLDAGFSFPLAINIALIFAATAAAASRAPEGAAEPSGPAPPDTASPLAWKGRPGSGAVPGSRKAGAGPGWSHLLRRLEDESGRVTPAPGPAPPRPVPPRPTRPGPAHLTPRRLRRPAGPHSPLTWLRPAPPPPPRHRPVTSAAPHDTSACRHGDRRRPGRRRRTSRSGPQR